VIDQFAFFPFGKEAISRAELNGRGDRGTGVSGTFANVVQLLVSSIWLAIGHVVAASVCFMTIIGIPFGFQHLKLAVLVRAHVGKTFLSKYVVEVVNSFLSA
jgi:uncharacterized membrane protein YccF (DUF307 family)